MAEGNQGQTPARATWSTESLQLEAYRLLKEFQTAASEDEATEEQRSNAETAKILVERAEKRAMSEIEKWAIRRLETFLKDIEGASIEPNDWRTLMFVSEAAKQLTRLEKNRYEREIPLDGEAWAAWDKACDELFALRAGRDVTKKQGAA